jgi:hypothetical protein
MGYSIHSYADCVKAFTTVRSPIKGKPVANGIRLYKDMDNTFRVTANERTFARITPDDMITFTFSAEDFYNTAIAFKLVYNLGSCTRLNVYRVGTRRYRIGCTARHDQVKTLPEYFGGIQFNLTNGMCTNPQPDRHARADKTARKVWLKTLKEYRRGLFTRLKLGVRGTDVGPSCFSTATFTQWMKDGMYPEALFDHLCMLSGGSTDYKRLTHEFENLINSRRDVLRKAFGVFND